MVKKILAVSFFLCITAIGIYGYLLFTRTNSFTLYKDSGQVMYEKPGVNYQKLIVSSLQLPSGTRIKTEDGTGRIVFNDNSLITLDVHTEIRVSIDKNTTTVVQTVGNTWHRIYKLLGGKEYNVETPTSLATVRGTKFAVEVPKDLLTPPVMYLTEGRLEVGQLIKQAGKKIWKNQQFLETNKQAVIPSFEKSKVFEIKEIDKERRETLWFKKNELLDKQFNKQDIRQFIDKYSRVEQAAVDELKKPVKEPKTIQPTISPTKQPFLEQFKNINNIQKLTDPKKLTEEYIQQMRSRYDPSIGGKEVCANINKPEFQKDLGLLEQYKLALGNNYEKVIGYVNQLREYCKTNQPRVINQNLEQPKLFPSLVIPTPIPSINVLGIREEKKPTIILEKEVLPSPEKIDSPSLLNTNKLNIKKSSLIRD